ncbi:MAG: tRNA 2-selenouridine(34) synthase MnmH [Gammaproteobacteria bacterium]|nr:tRNA 2-selenouridine(34) synthase MnmH [Gammaproteobacteria bacterium]
MVVVRNDYNTILRDNLPVLDVRAPTEFNRGSIPNSTNLPILNDSERSKVGIEYKQQGNEAAVKLGFNLVNEREKEIRVSSWSRFLHSNPDALLTCWRGGQRSEIAQRWLANIGIDVPRIAGGFKAIRQYSLEIFAQSNTRKWIVVAGSTGVGKTQFLNNYRESIDLEAIAHHRGSAFGQLDTPQPTPVSFELALTQCLLQTDQFNSCLIEDESRTIGRLAIPSQLYAAMQTSPIVVLESSLEARIQLTYERYVRNEDSFKLLNALKRIQKRLGRERYAVVKAQLDRAIEGHSESLHLDWIARLFDWYYDPMYEYQLNRKLDRVVFRGNTSEVRDFLRHEYQIFPT